MASSFYPIGLSALLHVAIPGDAEVYVCAVNDDYVFDVNHQFVEDLGATVVLDKFELANVTTDAGILKADDVRYVRPNLAGQLISAIIIFYGWESGDGGSQLLAYIDEAGVTIPQTLSDGDLFIRWNAQGILKIG